MQQKQEYDTHFKILLLGDSSVGKTTLLQKFVGEIDPDGYSETPGIEQKLKFISYADKIIKLRLWDASGSPKLRHLVRLYLPDPDGALVCFDVTNKLSFLNAKAYVERLRAYQNDVPIILIGCKSDLLSKRCISIDTAKEQATQLGLTYLETSGFKEINIKEAFFQITQQIYFSAELNKIKPTLEQYFNNYLRSSAETKIPGLFKGRSAKEILLKDEYQTNFELLFRSADAIELNNFYKKTLDIIGRADGLFSSENPLVSIVASSPLSKTLKRILSDLKPIVDLSSLKELTTTPTL